MLSPESTNAVWRLFTAPLMARSIIGCVIGTVIFASMAPKVERELGMQLVVPWLLCTTGLTFMPFVGSLGFLLLCATFAWGTQVLYTTIIVFFMLVPVIQMPMLVLNCSSGLGVCRSTQLHAACCCGVVLKVHPPSPVVCQSIWLGMLANTCASNPDQPRRCVCVCLSGWWQLARSLTRRFRWGAQRAVFATASAK